MLVDSHCHLDCSALNSQLDTVIARAKANGVEVLQTICTQINKFDTIVAIAHRYRNVFCSVGLHPLNIQEDRLYQAAEIAALCNDSKVIAIGETGLDYYYDIKSKKQQQDSFIQHIRAAQITGLPIIVHTRDAEEDTLNILAQELKNKSFQAVIHCFTGSHDLAIGCLSMGFYISASGIITFKKSTNLQQVFKLVPLDKILLETDAPFLAPVPKRGKTNEPSYIKYTAHFLANLLDISYEKLVDQSTENFFTLFDKAHFLKDL